MSDLTPHFGIFVTYEEVTGKRVRMADAAALLSRLEIGGVLKLIAVVNACFIDPRKDKSELRALQNALVARFFDSELKEDLDKSIYGTNKGVVVFHRQQQLLMLRLALSACPTGGGLPWDNEAKALFGKACLMVNDIAGHHEDELQTDGKPLGVASRMLAIGELPSDNQVAGLVGRSYDLWLQIANEQRFRLSDNYVAVGARFQEKYHVSLEYFVQGLFLLLMKTERFDPSQPDALDALLFNSDTYLGSTTFPLQTFQAILKIVSCELEAFRDRLVTEPVQNARFDFSLLRRYPLIEIEPNIFLCHDVGFLRKFFTDGVYWLVHEALPANEQEQFRAFFGKLLAVYVEGIVGHVYELGPNASKHLVKNRLTFTENRGEVCDLFVQCGHSWVVMETKASLLSTRAKYLGDATVLRQELNGKFVSTKLSGKGKGANKGVGQLANSIRMLAKGVPTNAQEIDVANCNLIYPVIISYDSAIISPGIPQYLEQQFTDQMASQDADMPAKPKVMPLTVLSIDDVEVLTTLKQKHEISTILSTYHNFRLPAETLAQFVFRYSYFDVDVSLSKFYDSFLALCKMVEPYLK